MNISAVKFDDLSQDEVNAWSKIQRAEPSLASPYFRPEFTQAVAAVRGDVEVAVLREDGQSVAFLPFHRSWWMSGKPVGGPVSDFQGLIAPAGVALDPREVLRGCGLTKWSFNHLVSEQESFAPFVCREADSPYIDIGDGLDAYITRHKAGRHIMYRHRRKIRKMAREIGPIRFEEHSADPAILATLIKWKSSQFRRTKYPNILDYSWVRNLLEKVSEYHTPDFSAMASVLYAGDTVAAIHFGMRSGAVLHGWFPAYNVDLAQYSPGFLCWIEIMKVAESLGIKRIDFGKGSESYKYRLMSDVAKVGEGTAHVRHASEAVRRAFWSLRDRIETSRLAPSARALLQNVRRARHWLDTRITN